jgi:hypothetical protein
VSIGSKDTKWGSHSSQTAAYFDKGLSSNLHVW